VRPARWGVNLAFATVGAEYGRIASHVFTDDSAAPICQPHVAGSPGALTAGDRAWQCNECHRLLERAWWSVTSFGKQRLWTVNATSLVAASVAAGVQPRDHMKPAADGFASDDLDAFNRALAAIEALLPADAPTLFSRSSDADAERVARERRAEARDRKVSDGRTGAQTVEYVYRHHKKHDYSCFRSEQWASGDWSSFYASAAKFTWQTESAKVLRKTKKRIFIESRESYTTASGSLVLKTYALGRAELERTGTSRWGWTTNPRPPADGQESTPAWATELGIEKPTTLADAKRAFRRKAKLAHPDSGGSPDAFRRVTDAFKAAEQHFGGGI